MFNYMDKFNVIARGSGGGGSGGDGYNSRASIRERQYTDTMRSMGYQNTRSYPSNTVTRQQAQQRRERIAKGAAHVSSRMVTQGGNVRECTTCHNWDPYRNRP